MSEVSGRLVLLLARQLMAKHGYSWSKALREAARQLGGD